MFSVEQLQAIGVRNIARAIVGPGAAVVEEQTWDPDRGSHVFTPGQRALIAYSLQQLLDSGTLTDADAAWAERERDAHLRAVGERAGPYHPANFSL